MLNLKKFTTSVLLIISFICSKNSYSHEATGDELDYKVDKVNLDTKKQLVKTKSIFDGENHFYGYAAVDSKYETNPGHDEKSEDNRNLSDSNVMARAQLLYSIDLSENSSWTFSSNMLYREYDKKSELDDDFLKFETGPSFYFPSIKLVLSVRPIYYFYEKDKEEYYSSKYPGGALKFSYSQIKDLNIFGSYEYEPRDYEDKSTDESDANIQKALLRFRYSIGKNIFNFFPTYRRYNTEIDSSSKTLYGFGLGYVRFLPAKFYMGLYYEMINSKYDNIQPGDNIRRNDVENYYTALIGYETKNNWIFELGYTKEKICSNLDYIATTYNNMFNFSIIYRFHFHNE